MRCLSTIVFGSGPTATVRSWRTNRGHSEGYAVTDRTVSEINLMPGTYPIVLVPGFARFDVIWAKLLGIDNNSRYDGCHYFRNIRTHLIENGFDVYHARLSWADSLDVGATELAAEVEQACRRFKSERVHIIGHSMGGLYARKMLYDFRDKGIPARVASLTTIGTPHHGSSFADWTVKWLGRWLRMIAGALGTSVEGIWDLTEDSTAALNAEISEWEETRSDVRYQAFAGKQRFLFVFSLLKLSWFIIHRNGGENDGLSSVVSARWNDKYFVGPVLDLDHLNQIGWWDPTEVLRGSTPGSLNREVKGVYLKICEELSERFRVG